MAGKVGRVQEKATFTFTGSNAIAAGKSVQIPVAVNIDTSQYLWAGTILRVHNFTVSGSGTGTAPSVSALLYVSAPTAEDPANVFRAASPVLTGTPVVFSATPPATIGPLLQFDMVSAAGKTGSYVDVLLNVAQWTLSGTPDITVTVSIDLIQKD